MALQTNLANLYHHFNCIKVESYFKTQFPYHISFEHFNIDRNHPNRPMAWHAFSPLFKMYLYIPKFIVKVIHFPQLAFFSHPNVNVDKSLSDSYYNLFSLN